MNKKLSAVLVGGSNSLMRPGYLTELPSALLKHDIDLNLTANLSVGNTTSLLGLMHLKLRPELIRETDVLLIEYTLNDTATYAATPQAVQLWVRAVEGIIRFARAENPSIKIACFLLATKVGMHRETINPLYAGIHYLAHYYQMAVADVNAAFMRRFGRDFYDLPGAYGDYAHYQRPVFTLLAAEVIAEEIAPTSGTTGRFWPYRRPSIRTTTRGPGSSGRKRSRMRRPNSSPTASPMRSAPIFVRAR